MVRTFLGTLLALTGAAAAVRSPFRPWYGGRHGTDIRIDALVTGVGVTPRDAALPGSLLLPMVFAALLALLGVLMRARYVVAPAGLLVLGATVLWMVRQAQAAGSLTAGGNGLDTGVAYALIGGLLLLSAGCVLPGPRARRFAKAAHSRRYPAPAPFAGPTPAPAPAPAPAQSLAPEDDESAPTLVGEAAFLGGGVSPDGPHDAGAHHDSGLPSDALTPCDPAAPPDSGAPRRADGLYDSGPPPEVLGGPERP